MKILLNNESVDFKSSNESLFDFLKWIKVEDKTGIAVAVNSSVISKSKWTNFKLKEGDEVMVITATAGG